ncbi:hypothetical protein NEOLEDRAFT_1138331 [Neolentinus lepideus HHB14362 ss-1]|uniref:Uncharacterized protein n=1 Tax=Neolentinus lepideus HHB14362 ss-1 TaxID=1314782 RepID=A0A165QBP0_9AGAM|nr:hypothetical protein NEOLEDRAFT_1138331 [Neolentinus lepideus HHB14362 ss-1]
MLLARASTPSASLRKQRDVIGLRKETDDRSSPDQRCMKSRLYLGIVLCPMVMVGLSHVRDFCRFLSGDGSEEIIWSNDAGRTLCGSLRPCAFGCGEVEITGCTFAQTNSKTAGPGLTHIRKAEMGAGLITVAFLLVRLHSYTTCITP